MARRMGFQTGSDKRYARDINRCGAHRSTYSCLLPTGASMQNDILPQVPSRRRFIGVAAAAVAAGSLSQFAFAQTSQGITEITPARGGDKTAIRKLRVHVPES